MKRALTPCLLLLIAGGCDHGLSRLKPRALSAGLVFRPVRGSNGVSTGDVTVPLVRLQADVPLTDDLDGYLRFDSINGRINAGEGVIDRTARGDMQALGAGVRYTPFCEYFGLELGGEFFHTDFAVISRSATFRNRLSDSAYGWAVNAGGSLHVPLRRTLDFVLAGGYAWGDNDSNHIHLDFDGAYWSFGLRWKLRWEHPMEP